MGKILFGSYELIFKIVVTLAHEEQGIHYLSNVITVHAETYEVAVRRAIGIATSYYSPDIREKVKIIETRGELYGRVIIPDAVQDRDAYIAQALAEAESFYSKWQRGIEGGVTCQR